MRSSCEVLCPAGNLPRIILVDKLKLNCLFNIRTCSVITKITKPILLQYTMLIVSSAWVSQGTTFGPTIAVIDLNDIHVRSSIFTSFVLKNERLSQSKFYTTCWWTPVPDALCKNQIHCKFIGFVVSIRNLDSALTNCWWTAVFAAINKNIFLKKYWCQVSTRNLNSALTFPAVNAEFNFKWGIQTSWWEELWMGTGHSTI